MIKVYYYPFKFWRAEVLRAGLFLQNIPFENITDMEQIKAKKSSTPFGAFPILELSDGQILSQTQAMAAYVGKLGGAEGAPFSRLYPKKEDILGQARCDEIINGCTDVTTTIGSSFGLPKDKVEAKRTELMDPEKGRLFMHLKGLDSLLCRESDFACGKTLTVADICVWRLVAWLSTGVLDYIPTDFVSSNFPNLTKVYTVVPEIDAVKDYVAMYHN